MRSCDNVTPTAICLFPVRRRRARPWLECVRLVVLIIGLSCIGAVYAQTPGQIAALRKEAEDLFYHGYENYMTHAFPEDELRPISCQPLTRDRDNPAHIEVNDPLGNYSLTLIDSLSTLAILASNPASPHENKPLRLFQDAIRDLVVQYGDGSDHPDGQGLRAKGFDLDSKVQVFETSIRGLGGLLSAHLFAVGDLPIRGYEPPDDQVRDAKAWNKDECPQTGRGIVWPNGFQYDGQLLRLADDLGRRLMPAFWSRTGIPYPRVNLRHGVPFYANSPFNAGAQGGRRDAYAGPPEITETCSAGAGSLVLEFTVLSRLTGDDQFELAAKRAFWAIWDRRSSLDLIGSGIDAETGNWIGSWTGIGAGVDSFFEYAFKSHILLSRTATAVSASSRPMPEGFLNMSTGALLRDTGPREFLDAWSTAHAAIKRHLYRGPDYQHPHYVQADLVTGAAKGFWIDALSAYYPGLLTLAGFVDEATETHLLQTCLWTRFSALPERWNLVTGGIEGGLGWWVGRPEFIESTYYLYRATADPWYFHVGEMALRDIKRRCWTRCGWASIQNVLTGEKTDRMESFFLGETAKYLFLLFDPGHPLNHLDEPFVFTTEGHPLVIPRSPGCIVREDEQGGLHHSTDNQLVCPRKSPPVPLSISNVAARGDVYHAANLARLHLMPTRDTVESVLGEYAADHPSITLADISSPSNYTYFPWTLPTNYIPFNATSSLIPTRPTIDITFPGVSSQIPPVPPLQRVKEGILINSVGGLRLGMIQDVPMVLGDGIFDTFRIHAINNIPLGKDEKVFLGKETGSDVLSAADPNFSRIRDPVLLDIVIDLDGSLDAENVAPEAAPDDDMLVMAGMDEAPENAMKIAWNALVSQISSLVKDRPQTAWPFATTLSLNSIPVERPLNDGNQPRYHLTAVTPTGPGAALLPEWPEVSTLTASNSQVPELAWETVYATDDLCNHRLPASVAKKHQVLVVKRGGCNFSQKISNIPAFVPSPRSLQLIIVVSYGSDESHGDHAGPDDEESLIRPYLDQHQTTPSGLRRHNPIPMVMVAGGERVYDTLARKTVGAGIKRRYHVETKGIRIANLIVF